MCVKTTQERRKISDLNRLEEVHHRLDQLKILAVRTTRPVTVLGECADHPRGEASCLENCVDRFLDSSLYMVKQIEQQKNHL